MKQLLQIHTTFGRINIHSGNGQFVRVGKYGSHQCETTMHKEYGGGVKMEKTPSKFDTNMIDVLDSITPMKVDTFNRQNAERGKEAAMEATARLAREGTMFMKPDVNAVVQMSEDVVLEDANKNYGIGWLPSVRMHTEYTPEELHFSYTRDRISQEVRLGENEFDYQPEKVSVEVAQKGDVSIKYVGEPNYFPTAFQRFNRLV